MIVRNDDFLRPNLQRRGENVLGLDYCRRLSAERDENRRSEDTAVIDYMTAAVRYFLLTQQAFDWEESYEDQKEKRTKADRL